MESFRRDSSEDDDSIINFRGIPDPDNGQSLSSSHQDESIRVNWMQSTASEEDITPQLDSDTAGAATSPVGVRAVREYSPDHTSSVYDDFHTIDWVQERNRNKLRHKIIYHKSGWRARVDKWFDAASGWLIVLLVGLMAGIMAGVVDITADWMTDLKNGVCVVDGGSFYDRQTCCWLSNETDFDTDNCHLWNTWSDVAGLSATTNIVLDEDHFYDFNVFNYFIYVLFSVVLATIAGLFVVICAPYAAGSGIPEVKTILSGFIIKGYLGASTLLVKASGMVLAVSAGLSLGKEGPLVHVACCCGNLLVWLFPKYRKNEAKKREVLSAAAAAGVSVAFGAPVGGVLFSLEEASYYFPHKTLWRSFFAALVAVFTLSLLNPYFTGSVALFSVNHSNSWHIFELIPFAILGVFGGVFGAVFIKGNVLWSKFRQWKLSRQPIPVIEIAVVALITGIINYPNPFTRMSSSELIHLLFAQCSGEDNTPLCEYNRTDLPPEELYHDTQALAPVWNTLWQLALAGLAKGVLTVFTYGMKVPAGLFIPSMFVGACAGRILGVLLEQLSYTYRESAFLELFCSPKSSCVTPGLYAMVGAAATLGGVTRMTVSLVVIMFELTGGLDYIVPIMVAVMISKWVGDAIVKDGIYDAHIILNGYPFLDSKEEYTLESVAADVMKPQQGDRPLECLYVESCTIRNLTDLLESTEYFGFPCVISRDSPILAGYITRKDIIFALDQIQKSSDVVDDDSLVLFIDQSGRFGAAANSPSGSAVNLRGFVDMCPTVISEEMPMERVVEIFRKMGLRQVLVTRNGKLLGIITKKDILRYLTAKKHRTSANIKYH